MKDTIQIGEMLRDRVIEEVKEPASLSEMEQSLRKILLRVGRVVLELWLLWLEKRYPKEVIPCRCGGEAKYLYRRRGTLRTMFGQVRYKRAYYTCPQCGQGTYPMDEQLGLRPNAMSAEMERLAGVMGVERPFEQGSRLFEELTLVSLSDHSLDKAAQAYGEEQMKREGEWETQAYDMEGLLERKRTVKAPRRLYGSIDGGRVAIRGESVQDAVWRELKAGAWFVTRAQPPTHPNDEWSIRAEHIHYYTDIWQRPSAAWCGPPVCNSTPNWLRNSSSWAMVRAGSGTWSPRTSPRPSRLWIGFMPASISDRWPRRPSKMRANARLG